MPAVRHVVTALFAVGLVSSAVAAETPEPLATALRLEDAFIAVADAAFPAVVGVEAWVAADAPDRPSGWTGPSPERRLEGLRRAGVATGFAVTADGYVLTCRGPLVDAAGRVADRVEVELSGDRFERARVVALEPTLDLAILKIEPSAAIAALSLDDDAPQRTGQWVVAAGDPPGAERTFAAGTLSVGAQRECYQEEHSATLLQAAVTLPPRSTCGPLLDIRGRVLGITVPPRGGEPVPGTTYGLPATLVRELFEPLRRAESTRSPWIGISVLALTHDVRDRLQDPPRTGIVIDNVFAPSPASEAGVRIDDVLTAIDGERVLAVADFQKALYLAGIGGRLTLELSRAGESLTVEVAVQQRPPTATTR